MTSLLFLSLLLALTPPDVELVGRPTLEAYRPLEGLILRFPLRVRNPNPFGIALEGLELLLDDRPTLTNAPEVVRVGAGEAADIDLDVLLPLTQVPVILEGVWELLTGVPLSYRLEGRFRLEGLGLSLPPRTLASGTLTLASVPNVRLDPSRTGLLRDGLGAMLAVGLEAHNPTALPYGLEGSGVGLYAGERVLAHGEVEPVTLRPRGLTPLTLRFRLSGRALTAQLLRPAGGLELRGEVLLTLPRLGTIRVPLSLPLELPLILPLGTSRD